MERSHGTSTMAVFFGALIILSSGCCSSASALKLKAVNFTYYLHDDFVLPDVSAVKVTGPNLTLGSPATFGEITVFDSVLKETISNDSAQIGHSSGQVTALKESVEKFITFVQDITILGYSGTISCSARFNFSAPNWEVGVNSGTGSFRGASGYLTASVAVPDPAGYILKYEANLILPQQ
ncbi:protein MpDIR60 [Marchantia polymorpha subsp. ruderalis]|nr:hypothetical protein MARPO_0333s0001 [Marchantia polymorpha]BBN14731.1 hypothetical protein Mp_6g14010 [Marchantia polymorpha subsp. ruderalis]|eukprot:PTQ26822.1 hypothetical protein MARPO_0333s0001 [Marchantia polymorpha]